MILDDDCLPSAKSHVTSPTGVCKPPPPIDEFTVGPPAYEDVFDQTGPTDSIMPSSSGRGEGSSTSSPSGRGENSSASSSSGRGETVTPRRDAARSRLVYREKRSPLSPTTPNPLPALLPSPPPSPARPAAQAAAPTPTLLKVLGSFVAAHYQDKWNAKVLKWETRVVRLNALADGVIDVISPSAARDSEEDDFEMWMDRRRMAGATAALLVEQPATPTRRWRQISGRAPDPRLPVPYVIPVASSG